MNTNCSKMRGDRMPPSRPPATQAAAPVVRTAAGKTPLAQV